MGQKVNPLGIRLGITRDWTSRWYAGKNEYGRLLLEDMKIRKELLQQLKQAAVSKIVIERPHKKCRVTIQSARPGVVIGKKGADIDELKVSLIHVDEAPQFKRFAARAKGRGTRIVKRNSHITVGVSDGKKD